MRRGEPLSRCKTVASAALGRQTQEPIMSTLAQIAPKEKLRMIDLVKAAGVDVSDWSNSKRGRAGAAMNPKYCYEWSFVEPRRVVVLNIWHHAMKENDGGIIIRD